MLSLSSSVLVNGLPGTLLSDAELFTVELLLYPPRSSPSIVHCLAAPAASAAGEWECPFGTESVQWDQVVPFHQLDLAVFLSCFDAALSVLLNSFCICCLSNYIGICVGVLEKTVAFFFIASQELINNWTLFYASLDLKLGHAWVHFKLWGPVIPLITICIFILTVAY